MESARPAVDLLEIYYLAKVQNTVVTSLLYHIFDTLVRSDTTHTGYYATKFVYAIFVYCIPQCSAHDVCSSVSCVRKNTNALLALRHIHPAHQRTHRVQKPPPSLGLLLLPRQALRTLSV